MAHVVTDADADLKQNQLSRAEPIKMYVSLTSEYRSRVLLRAIDVKNVFFMF